MYGFMLMFAIIFFWNVSDKEKIVVENFQN